MADPLAAYLRELRDIHSTGAAVAETSYYPALSNLLNEIGKTLKPKVRCVVNIANRGAGLPDAGLFTADQIRKKGKKADYLLRYEECLPIAVVEAKAEDREPACALRSVERFHFLRKRNTP